MAIPIRLTVDDIQAVCGYLAKKPTGATLSEAKRVLDAKHFDARKLAALKYFSLIEDQERLKLASRGRDAVRDNFARLPAVLAQILDTVPPYRAVLERAAHRNEQSFQAVEVAAHWHEHFGEDVSENEEVLNAQAVCFFQLAAGAGLGELVVGRRGAPTRFEINGDALKQFVDSDAGHGAGGFKQPEQQGSEEQTPRVEPSASEQPQALGTGIFIAHGKNKKPLEQLKRILEQFRIPYKVAVEEPNLGRPIGTKVKEIMQACNCAILIFTADEEFQDKSGSPVWRPSENVVFELGASGYLYGNRIVILKEDTVEFPSNFKDLGYISFAHDQLENKSMDVLRELIGFGIVKIST